MRVALIGLVLFFGLGAAPALARQTCKDFKTCDEAKIALKAGNTGLDRDKDGIPCETLCGN